MKKFIAIFLIFGSLFFSSFFIRQKAFALQAPTPTPTLSSSSSTGDTATGTFTTCIKGKPCDKSIGSTSNNTLVKAAEDLYHAFVAYSGNDGASNNTWDPTRFTTSLSRYTDPQFKNNISLTISSNTCGTPLQCVCFAYMSAALATGNKLSPDISGAAASAFNYPSFQAGSNYFKNMGSYIPQAGDIGIANWAPSGHMLIVKQPQGTRSFVAIEGNWNDQGGVRDSGVYLDQDFHFFHLQSK